MDRDYFIKSLKEVSPLIVAGLATILNIVAFSVDVFGNQLDSTLLALVVLASSIISSALLWAFTAYYIRKRTRPGRISAFEVLESEDIFDIEENGSAIHKYIVTFKVNQESPVYVLYSPETSGQHDDILAYQSDNPQVTFEVSTLKARKIVHVNLGKTLEKGDRVNKLCIEWRTSKGFTESTESISIVSEPSQSRCIGRVVLPKGRRLITSEWYCSYNRSIIPLHHGNPEVSFDDSGRCVLTHDFGQEQKKESDIELTCTISWKWKISPREATVE